MQAKRAADFRTRQLSLNLSDGFFVPTAQNRTAHSKRTVVFPKHIDIPHFGAFQKQVNALFAPFGIVVEFSLSRQKRLQMTWIFPPEPANFSQQASSSPYEEGNLASPAVLSNEELSAFTNVVFAFAGQP